MRRIIHVSAPILAAFCLGTPASAQFAICNQSFDVVNVAIALGRDGLFTSEGWWTIGTNQCANVIQEDLSNRYIYVYATDVFGQPILDGTHTMCVGAKKFTIGGNQDCLKDGHRSAQFLEVDTLETERWTLFLTERGAGQ